MASQVPHVLVFPFPAQGHINSMFRLAKLLSLAGLQITFLNSDYNHNRLCQNADLDTWLDHWPGFRLRTISDGLPLDYPRTAETLINSFNPLKTKTKLLLHDMLVSDPGLGSDNPITCIIADGIMSYVIDVARDVGLPIVSFRTISACSYWSYFCTTKLVEAGEIPFEDGAAMDLPVRSVPGMESFLRRRDLPSFFRAKQLSDPGLQLVWTETINSTRATAFIFNTFDDLESTTLSHIQTQFPKIYTIGPLQALLRSRLADSPNSPPSDCTESSSLWKEDKSCLTWLDSKPPNSVVYISFGSYAVLTRDELLEFWHGLVNSRKPFLWAIRPDLVNRKGDVGQIPEELVEATGDRGCLVEWAPQEEVLAHPAVGGFLTHSGWNSTLESVFAGVPMICWSFFADQQINSRFVEKVWGLGLDMKDKCSRELVAKMVRELMEDRREEYQNKAEHMATLAKRAVNKGGSSYMNLEKLIEDIKTLSF